MLGLGIVFFLFVGKEFVVNEKLVKFDVIIVLSGDNDWLEKGIELYKKGYVFYLIFLNG